MGGKGYVMILKYLNMTVSCERAREIWVVVMCT